MIKPSAYDIDTLQEFFDRDTYADLLDLLVDLVSGDYSLANLRLDIDDYLVEHGDSLD